MQTNTRKAVVIALLSSMVAGSLCLPINALAGDPAVMPATAAQAPLAPAPAAPEPMFDRPNPSIDQMVVDGIFIRPLMLAATAAGSILYLATLPASALGGNAEQAANKMVVEPAKATFRTCLGCLLDYNAAQRETWH
jgi:hypothetical protein